MPMTLFGLVRHGQTDLNLRGEFQGASDAPLNDTGCEQAHHVLDDVPHVDWDVVVASPLKRAHKTASIIAEDHRIPFGGTDADLVEIDWGIAEGRDTGEMEELYPARDFPGREDPQQVVDRTFAALDRLHARFAGQRVLVVAHGTVIRLVLESISEQYLGSIPNGALSTVVRETTPESTWQVRMIAGAATDVTRPASPSRPGTGLVLGEKHIRPRSSVRPSPAS
jgi:uncharacterized phosphatase